MRTGMILQQSSRHGLNGYFLCNVDAATQPGALSRSADVGTQQRPFYERC